MFAKSTNRGLTAIELLTVVATTVIISATIIPIGSAFLVRSNLRNKSNELVSSLVTAQLNSQNNKENRQWGVEVSGTTIKLYAVGDTSFDQTFQIPGSISITNDTVVFDKLTGNPDATATFTISTNTGDTTTISVNEVGAVDVN